VGGCIQSVQIAWLSLGLALEMPCVGHCCPPMHERVEKTVSRPAHCPFPAGKPLSQFGRAVAGWMPWLLQAR